MTLYTRLSPLPPFAY
ncbi:hypothetical protein YPPY66_3812, partial [Yersinia pestis PY-66]